MFYMLTVNACGVVLGVQVEHVCKGFTYVAEPRAVDRKHVLQENTFSRLHVAFAHYRGIRRENKVRSIPMKVFRRNWMEFDDADGILIYMLIILSW